jgi:hypothetical protein
MTVPKIIATMVFILHIETSEKLTQDYGKALEKQMDHRNPNRIGTVSCSISITLLRPALISTNHPKPFEVDTRKMSRTARGRA